MSHQYDRGHRDTRCGNSSLGPRGIVAIDKQGDRILFLNPRTYETEATLAGFPTLPHELALAPDRQRAYIPAYGDGVHGDNPHPNHVVSVVDLLTRTRLPDIDLKPLSSPHTLRFGPDGLLYVCCENSHAVAVIDPAQQRMIASIDTGSRNTHRLAILPRRQELWTENEEDRSLTVVDLNARRAVASITLPHAIAGIAVDPDERFVIAVDADKPQLLIIDTARRVLLHALPLEGHRKGSQVARFSEDGQHLLVVGDHEPVITLLDASLQRQRTIQVGRKPMDAAFSLDGKTLVVANEGDGTLSVIDLTHFTVTQTVAAGTGCETLAYF